MEAILLSVLLVLWFAIQAAVLGGALAAGAWIVWRLLDGRFAGVTVVGPRVPDSIRWPRVMAIGAAAGGGALWLAWIMFVIQRKTAAAPVPEFVLLSAVPFVVVVAVAAIGITFVRAVAADRRRRIARLSE
jgi:hypothetical protein